MCLIRAVLARHIREKRFYYENCEFRSKEEDKFLFTNRLNLKDTISDDFKKYLVKGNAGNIYWVNHLTDDVFVVRALDS